VNPERIEELLAAKPPDEPEYRGRLVLDRVATDRVRPGPLRPAARAVAGLRSTALLVVAVGLVIGAIVAAGSSVPATTPGSSLPQVSAAIGMIPWINATPPPSPTAEPTTDPSTLPACQPSDLALVAGGWGGATGSMGGGIVLVNVSANPCHVAAKPSVELLDATGQLIAAPAAGWNPAGEIVALAAGGGAGGILVWSNWCLPPPSLPLRVRATIDRGATPLTAEVRVWESGGPEVPRCDDPLGGTSVGVATPLVAPGPPSGGAEAAPCASGDIVAFSGVWGAGLGSSYTSLVVFNGSGVDCTVPSSPKLELRDASGRLLASTEAGPAASQAVVLPSNGTARASLAFADWCVAPPALPLHLDLRIGSTAVQVNAQTVVSPEVAIPVPPCMAQPATPPPGFDYNEPFTVPGSPEPPPPDPGDTLPFTVTIPSLATVQPGSILGYSVTLTNIDAFDKPINLAAMCPSYVEKLFVPGSDASVDTELVLNCSPAGTVDPGASRTFEMRLAIPSDASTGKASLVWQLGQRGPAAKVVFTIGP
jgi:hypothetical protein